MITILCTRSRGPRGFFCLHDFRRGPVNVAVILLETRVNYRLKTLFLAISAIACLTTAVLFIRSVEWSYSRIVSINCGANRTIIVYEDSFCDFATIPVFDVVINGRKSESKYPTTLWYECGDQLDANLFSHIIDETGEMVAVIYDGDVVAIYDFESSCSIELPSSGKLLDIPIGIRDRLNLTDSS